MQRAKHQLRKALFPALAAGVLLMAEQAAAANYYVSASGNDGASGTQPDKPLKTVNKAVSLLRDGDSIFLRAGDVFEPSGVVNIMRSGTADEPVVFGAYEIGGDGQVVYRVPAERRPVLDGKTTVPTRGSYYGLIHVGGQHVHVRDVVVKNSGGVGVRVEKTQHNVVDNVTTDWTYFAGIQVLHATDVKINGCSVTGFGQGGRQFGEPQYPAGISLRRVTDVRVGGCIVHEGWGEGINTFDGSRNVTIENNVVFAARNIGVYVDSTRVAVVRNNMILGTSNNAYHRYEGFVGHGITLNNEKFQFKAHGGSLDPSAMAADVQIYNNLVAGTAGGIAFWGQLEDTVWKNVVVAHNTFVDNQTQFSPGNAAFSNSLIANNIFLSISANAKDFPSGMKSRIDGVTWGTNYWTKGPPSGNYGKAVSGGLSLVKTTGWQALTSYRDVTWRDFAPAASAPTVGAGSPLAAVTGFAPSLVGGLVKTDFNLTPHRDPPDLGAIAFKSTRVPKQPELSSWSQ